MKLGIFTFFILLSFDYIEASKVPLLMDIILTDPPSPIAIQSRKRKERAETAEPGTTRSKITLARVPSSTDTTVSQAIDSTVPLSTATTSSNPINSDIGLPDVLTPEYFYSMGLHFNRAVLDDAISLRKMNLLLARQINGNLAKGIGMFDSSLIPRDALAEFKLELFLNGYADAFIETLIEEFLFEQFQDP